MAKVVVVDDDNEPGAKFTAVPVPRTIIPLTERIKAAVAAFAHSSEPDYALWRQQRMELVRKTIAEIGDEHQFAVLSFINQIPSGPHAPDDLNYDDFIAAVKSVDDFAGQAEIVSYVCNICPGLVAKKQIAAWARENATRLARK